MNNQHIDNLNKIGMSGDSLNSYFKKEIKPDISGKIHFISDNIKANDPPIFKGNLSIEPPGIECISNALVLPGRIIAKDWVEDLVYDSELQPVESARLKFARLSPVRKKNSRLEKLNHDKERLGRCVYGGILITQFGHFLTESLSRLWILSTVKDIPKDITFIFHRNHPRITNEYLNEKKYMDYFILLGIHDKIKIIDNQSVICEQLLIPSPALYLDNSISYQMKNLWDHISEQAIKNLHASYQIKKKVYFSRVGLEKSINNRKLLNEIELEKCLKKNGFEIIRPHDLRSEKEKIQLLSKVDVLIGGSGSGLHNAVFMKPKSIVIQLVNLEYPNGLKLQNAICLIKNIYLHSIVDEDKAPEWRIDINKVESILQNIGVC